MKITEYIAALEAIRAEHGDLEVETASPDWPRKLTERPVVFYHRVPKDRLVVRV